MIIIVFGLMTKHGHFIAVNDSLRLLNLIRPAVFRWLAYDRRKSAYLGRAKTGSSAKRNPLSSELPFAVRLSCQPVPDVGHTHSAGRIRAKKCRFAVQHQKNASIIWFF